MHLPQTRHTLFPYTTLFRSGQSARMIPIKSAKEVEKMRQACRTASEILDRVSELVRPGITTKEVDEAAAAFMQDRKSTRLNSSHRCSSYAVFCLKKKKKTSN